jgi:hypothetical protein
MALRNKVLFTNEFGQLGINGASYEAGKDITHTHLLGCNDVYIKFCNPIGTGTPTMRLQLHTGYAQGGGDIGASCCGIFIAGGKSAEGPVGLIGSCVDINSPKSALNDPSPELLFQTGATHYNWRIAAQESVSNGFEIASSTTVNDNAYTSSYTNRLVIKGDTGNVGVGTDQPSAALSVQYNPATTNGFELIDSRDTNDKALITSSGGGLGIYTTTNGSFSSSNLAIAVDTSQRVGIGTDMPEHTLHVKGSGNGAVIEVEDTAANGNPVFRLKNDAQEWQWQLRGAESDSLVAWDVTGATGRLYLTTAGNLGIGTASPNEKLTISGPFRSASQEWQTLIANSDSFAADKGGGIAFGGSYTGSTQTYFSNILGAKENGTDGNVAGYLAFYTRSSGQPYTTERARIDSSGNMTLQTNQAADTALEIYNTNTSTSAKASLKVGFDAANHLHIYRQGNLAGIFYNATQSGSSHQFQIAGSAKATLDSTGLGVGTGSPAYKLESSTSSTGISYPLALTNPDNSTNAAGVGIIGRLGRTIDSFIYGFPMMALVKDGTWTGSPPTNIDGHLRFYTVENEASVERARIKSNGIMQVGGQTGTLKLGNDGTYYGQIEWEYANNELAYTINNVGVHTFNTNTKEVARFTQSFGSGGFNLKSNAGNDLIVMGPEGSGGNEENAFIAGYANGTQKFSIGATTAPTWFNTGQNFGIGDSSPNYLLEVKDGNTTSTAIQAKNTTGSQAALQIAATSSSYNAHGVGNSESWLVDETGNALNIGPQSGKNTPIKFVQNGGVIGKWDAGGAFGIGAYGTNSLRTNQFFISAYCSKAQIEGTGISNSTGEYPILGLSRSRGTTIGSHTLVANNDYLGAISFHASNGSSTFVQAAGMSARINNVSPAVTIASNQFPTDLIFSINDGGADCGTSAVGRFSHGGNFLVGCNLACGNGMITALEKSGYGVLEARSLTDAGAHGGAGVIVTRAVDSNSTHFAEGCHRAFAHRFYTNDGNCYAACINSLGGVNVGLCLTTGTLVNAGTCVISPTVCASTLMKGCVICGYRTGTGLVGGLRLERCDTVGNKTTCFLVSINPDNNCVVMYASCASQSGILCSAQTLRAPVMYTNDCFCTAGCIYAADVIYSPNCLCSPIAKITSNLIPSGLTCCNSNIKTYTWPTIMCGTTSASCSYCYHVVRWSYDPFNWGNGGYMEFTLTEWYYGHKGGRKKYRVHTPGYVGGTGQATRLDLIDSTNKGGSYENYGIKIVGPTVVDGTAPGSEYIDIYVTTRYYYAVQVQMETNAQCTTSNPPQNACMYICTNPTAQTDGTCFPICQIGSSSTECLCLGQSAFVCGLEICGGTANDLSRHDATLYVNGVDRVPRLRAAWITLSNV